MHGLYLLWWVEERGISPATVAALLAVGDLAAFLLEVPTGWVADRLGHRASLIAGSSLQALGMLACWLGRGVPDLVIASLLVACGDAFRSGADQALLYRTCVALGREDRFQPTEARTRAAGLVALVVLLLGGGVMVTRWGFAAGWAAEVGLSLVGLAIACAMIEPPSGGSRNDKRESTPVSTRPLRRAHAIAILVIPAALLGGAASASSFLAQTGGLAGLLGVTVLVAAITLAESAGAATASLVTGAGLRGQWMLAAFGTAAGMLAVAIPSTLLMAAVALSFLVGVAQPIRAVLLQRLAHDDARARVASAASACDMVCSAVALLLAGGWSRAARRH
ncbi:MAG TPA: MFS transporter [Vicinamibacterales bacterium]|nr:MFS transporter [Vicinamibacterales bacterium]